MLAQVALVVFGLLAMLGLVIDTGLLRLTQGQMQSAADGAALEGLRNRDVITQAAGTGLPVPNAFANDCVRRVAAHRVARAVFDEALYAAEGDAGYNYGAGPVVTRTAGTTSLHAGQTIAPDAPYEPRLQLNQQNAVYGDMVSGRFTYADDPVSPEDAAYVRTDFTPSAAAPTAPPALPECPDPDADLPATWPASSTAVPLTSDEHEAFLVRLRRSNELEGLDGQVEPGVASSGPSLPLLFGHGAPIHGDTPESPYSVRRDGFTVRASAIARVRPAMQVGLPRATPLQPGVTPFVLQDVFAATPAPPTGAPVTIDPVSGSVCAGTACPGPPTLVPIGRFISASATPVVAWLAVATVGQAVAPAPVPVTCATALPRAAGFAPVVATVAGAGAAPRVIGFTWATLVRDPARPTNLCAGLLLRAPSRVAPSNATATLPTTLPLPAGASAAAVRDLFDRHFQAPGRPAYQPVLAPALAQ